MKKHNRDHRRMMALLRGYRRIAEYQRVWNGSAALTLKIVSNWPITSELRILEARLPPELVAWAKLNV